MMYLIRVAPGVTSSLKMVSNPKHLEIGGYTPASFELLNLPPNVIPLLVSNSNASLAVSTWGKYSSIHTQIGKVE